MTGHWFEFNDETVKLLPDGPSCSYDPEETVDGKQIDTTKITGSQDAYNMYYVEESYLAKNSISCLLRRERLCSTNPSLDENAKDQLHGDALVNTSRQRDAKYESLTE